MLEYLAWAAEPIVSSIAASIRQGSVALAATLTTVVAGASEPPPADREVEEFLRTARVVKTREIGEGVTLPQRLTLSDGERTIQASWKTIDEYAPVKNFHDGRPVELGFRDSWKHEIAAYELDKLLGFGLVPPTVARKIRGIEGAIQLWVEGAITETERRRQGIQTTDPDAWNRQVYTVRLFRQLTHDTDFNNTGNLLVGEGFRLWAIDYSRAFKTRKKLLATQDLQRFPVEHLARLRRLEAAELEAATGDWLSKGQRAALLARRDLVIRYADKLLAERGAKNVLLP